MFCFQCEQTAGCTGCKGRAGVCGKSAVVARLQDELTGALIGLAQALESCPEAVAEVARLVLEALFTTVTNVNFDESTMHAIIDRVKAETARLGGEAADFDVETIWQTDEDTRSLKSLVLFGLRGMAAYAYHAMVLGFTDPNLDAFIAKSLACLGRESSHDILIPLVLDVGKYNLICMELLNRANTTTYGNPSPYQKKKKKGLLSSSQGTTSTISNASSNKPKGRASTSIHTAKCSRLTDTPNCANMRI